MAKYHAYAVSPQNFSQRVLMYTLSSEQMQGFIRDHSLTVDLQNKADNVYLDGLGGKWQFKQDKILGFSGEHLFLSNFVLVEVTLDGLIYPSIEHAYQAAKTLHEGERIAIRTAPTAGKAKRLGQKVTMRPDWDEVKIDVMHDLLIQKFSQPPFTTQLLATEDAYLEETNTWNDTYWGVCRGKGRNNLGKLLMEIRGELRAASQVLDGPFSSGERVHLAPDVI